MHLRYLGLEQCLEIHSFINFPMLLVEGILIHMIMKIIVMLMSIHMHTLWKTSPLACLFYLVLYCSLLWRRL